MGFQLDTSGYVQCPAPDQKPNETTGCWFWTDLSPFAQGYVGALFADLSVDLLADWLDRIDPYRTPGFSDLAPETLTRALEDCRAILTRSGWSDTQENGAIFWAQRQSATRGPDFAPLTPTLGDDGKVYLRGAAPTPKNGEGA